MGQSTSDTLSPTPPVECLSTVGRPTADRSRRSPLSIMAAVHVASSSSAIPRNRMAMSNADGLLVGDLAGGVGVEEPADGVVGDAAAVALGPDDVDGVHDGSVRPSICVSSKAPGSTSRIGVGVPLPSTRQSGPPCLPQELAAPPARHHGLPVTGHRHHRDEPPAATRRQRRDQPALGAQRRGRRTRSPRCSPRRCGRRRPARRRRRGSVSTARRRGWPPRRPRRAQRIPVDVQRATPCP